jgi:membrane-bound lytic murein transglycosylase D
MMKQLQNSILPVTITLLLFFLFKQLEDNFGTAKRPEIQSNSASLWSFASATVVNNDTEKTAPAEKISAPQRIHPVRITGDIYFAGEQVPLHDLEVRERFDRELLVNTFWHSNTMLSYKLSNKYFETIEPILKKHGIPEDFKYLAVAESGLRHVVSPAGAAGFWQFLASTGKEFGLEVTPEVDERYDLAKATEAACKYLLNAKKKFGSWTLAAASYNVGMARIEKSIEKQKVDSYYDLYLNDETSRYVFRILAFKMLFENPEDFGFNIHREDLYENYKYREIVVNTSIPDLAQYAINVGTNYKMLKHLNPWLRDSKLTVTAGKQYTLKVPVEN